MNSKNSFPPPMFAVFFTMFVLNNSALIAVFTFCLINTVPVYRELFLIEVIIVQVIAKV